MKIAAMLPRLSILLWILKVFLLPTLTYSTASKTARSWHPLTLQQLANNNSEDTAPFDGGLPDIRDFDWSASISAGPTATLSRKAVAVDAGLGHKGVSLLATATGEYSASLTEAPLDMKELQAPGSDSAVPVRASAGPVVKGISQSPSSSGFLQFPPLRISASQPSTTLQTATEDQKLIAQAVALQEELNNKVQFPAQQVTGYRNDYQPTTTLQALKTATEVPAEDSQPPTIFQAVSEDEELRKQAADLQQELIKVREALGSKPPQVAADKSELSSSFKDVLLRAVARDDETTTTLAATDATAAAAAAVAELYQQEFSTYSQIGLFLSLGLQLALVAAMVSFVWWSDRLNYDDFGNGPTCGMIMFFVLSDVVWGYILMTGVIDSYIEQFLLCLLLGVILFGHIGAILFMAHTWAHKTAYNLYHGSGIDKCAVAVLNIENKIDMITSSMGVSVPQVLHNNLYDSETEGGGKPAAESDDPPPGEDAAKMGIRVTMVKAEGLRDSDGNWGPNIKKPKIRTPRMLEKTMKRMEDTSDPYCTCAVRGRKAACWARSPAIQNNVDPYWGFKLFINDFRTGDTLKFKVWDSDMGVSSELLGKVAMPYQDVMHAIADGHKTKLVLEVPEKLEKQSPGQKSLLFVTIEKQTLGMNLRANVRKSERGFLDGIAKLEEEVEEDGHKAMFPRHCC